MRRHVTICRIVAPILIASLLAPPAWADIASDMQNFMNRFGIQNNITKPNVYNAQRAGSFVGGSFAARIPNNNDPVVYFRAPKISAGCEGIDLSLGAFSVLSTDQIINKLKQIGQSALSYAFSLALAYFLPTSYGTLMDNEGISNIMNAINMDSCNAGRALVNSAIDEITANSASNCARGGTEGGITQDRASAIKQCRNRESAGKKSDDPTDPSNGVTSFNLVYEILRPAANLDQEVKESIMSLIDGMIYVDESTPITPLPATIQLSDFLGHNSGDSTGAISVTIHHCTDTDFCLRVQDKQVQWVPFRAQVGAKMKSLYNSLKTGSPVKSDDIELVNSTPFPLWRLLSAIHKVDGAHFTAVDSYIDKYSIVVAMEILHNQLARVERAIRQGAFVSKLPSDAVKRVEERVKSLRDEYLIILRHPNYPNTTEVFQTLDRLEKEIARRSYAISPTLIQFQRAQAGQ
jgi:conjugative transfer pilus assembly protein TraH